MRAGHCSGDGAFEVVKKLFDHRVVRRNHNGAELDPVDRPAFQIQGVTHQYTGATGYCLQYVPAVDDAPIHVVEGEFGKPAGYMCGARVPDFPMAATGSRGEGSI